MSKQRIEYIDLAKGICISFVLFFHLCQMFGLYHYEHPFAHAITSVNDVIGVFRMPLYFFLSGCFFKPYSGFGEFLRKKTNKLLIPFVFAYIFISFLVPQILYRFWGLRSIFYQPLKHIFDAFLFYYYPSVPIWFLLCLFEMGIIFYGIYYLSNRMKNSTETMIIISLVIGAFSIFLGSHKIDLPANIDTAMTNIPYYMAGYMIFRKTPFFYPNKYDNLFLLCTPVAIAIIAYLLPTSDVFNNHFARNAWMSLYPCGLLGVLSIIMLAKKLRKLPILSYFGRYSIIILISHFLVIEILKHFLLRFHLPLSAHFIFTTVITIASFFIIIPLARKYLPHVTAQKDLI